MTNAIDTSDLATPEPPATPASHVKPGFCCRCGSGPKLFGNGADTSRYRRRRFVLSGGAVTTMAFCPDCAPLAGESRADLRAQLLDGWWQALHGRTYRAGQAGWECVQVQPEVAPGVLARAWPHYTGLVHDMRLDTEYGTATYAEVDADEGIIRGLRGDA